MGCAHSSQALKMKLGMACARMASTNMPLLSRPASAIKRLRSSMLRASSPWSWLVRCQVRVDSTGHALEPELMHREKGEIGADEEQPKVPYPYALAEHASSDLRKPIIQAAEQRQTAPPIKT